MTVDTPITTPRMVSAERSLFARKVSRAIWMLLAMRSVTIILRAARRLDRVAPPVTPGTLRTGRRLPLQVRAPALPTKGSPALAEAMQGLPGRLAPSRRQHRRDRQGSPARLPR